MDECPQAERLYVPERLARALYKRALAYYPGEAGGLLYGRQLGGTIYVSDYIDTTVRSEPTMVRLRSYNSSSTNGVVIGSWHSHPARGNELHYIPGPLLIANATPSNLDLEGALERARRSGCWLVEAVISVAPPGPGLRFVAAFYVVEPSGRVILGSVLSGTG